MSEAERFYKNIKYLAKRYGVKMGDIEDRIGVSRGYISRTKDISVFKANKIARELDIELTDLLEKDLCNEIEAQEIKEEIERLQEMLVEVERR